MPLPRFDKLPEERRRGILDAALDGFAADGYANASYNRILAAAGLSKGAMYYYFADKEDLYLTVLEHALDGLGGIEPPAAAAGADGFWAHVAQAYDAALAQARRDPRVVRMLHAMAADMATLMDSPRMATLLEACRGWFAAALANGRASRAVRRDLDDAMLVDLVFAIGEFADRTMLARGELDSDAGARRARERGVDLIRRVLQPAA